ncbi:MAG: methyltransferase family protein [Thermodesulfobacteriota bacterium]
MRLISLLLLQILTIGYIVLSGPVITQNIIVLSFEVFALFLIIWTLWTIKFDKFSLYNPRLIKSRLIPKGPFVYIRHPVYTAFLILAVCWMINYFSILRLLAFLILVVSVIMSVSYYESILSRKLNDFGLYKQKTYRLIPFVY